MRLVRDAHRTAAQQTAPMNREISSGYPGSYAQAGIGMPQAVKGQTGRQRRRTARADRHVDGARCGVLGVVCRYGHRARPSWDSDSCCRSERRSDVRVREGVKGLLLSPAAGLTCALLPFLVGVLWSDHPRPTTRQGSGAPPPPNPRRMSRSDSAVLHPHWLDRMPVARQCPDRRLPSAC
jgi:hypothetical protein